MMLLGLFGLFFIASRANLLLDIALGLMDRLDRIESAPRWQEIVLRLVAGILVPAGMLLVGFAGRDSFAIVIGTIAGLGLVELVFRISGLRRWRKVELHFPTLKSLLLESVESAARELASAKDLKGKDLEASALAVASAAIRESKTGVLLNLEESLQLRAEESRGQDRLFAERALALVRADYARLVDPASSAVQEAEALRLLPVGHPRRLALGLFVATAALEQDDPTSAVKALGLLQNRDVSLASARVLVNWLLMQAADKLEDAALSVRCRNALMTFDLRREAGRMNINDIDSAADPYVRWIRRAREALLRGE